MVKTNRQDDTNLLIVVNFILYIDIDLNHVAKHAVPYMANHAKRRKAHDPDLAFIEDYSMAVPWVSRLSMTPAIMPSTMLPRYPSAMA